MIRAVTIVLLLLWAPAAWPSNLLSPTWRIQDGQLLVDVKFPSPPEKFQRDVRNGLARHVEYQIDLMRDWEKWMDEYISGETIVRTVKYDVLKKEFFLTSREGRYLYEKTVSDMNEALRWLTTLSDVRVASLASLPAGNYYIRAEITSPRIKPAGAFSLLLFFMPEKEFSMTTVSPVFSHTP